MKNGSARNNLVLLGFVIVFLMGMFLCSAYTSPLYPDYYGADSALFALLGKGMVAGKTLYRDLFDHKGPVLFFIEALGYLIGSVSGIFLLQCLFGVINLVLSYNIWKKVAQAGTAGSLVHLSCVFVSGCAVLFYTFQGGNLSEEFSLPFILVCILLFVNYAQRCETDVKHPCRYSFVYGMMLMLLFLIRVNNAITVLSGICAIVLFLAYKKEYKNILINVLFGLFGMCAAALPVFVYFSSKSALYDMIYAAFIHNVQYASNSAHQSIVANLPKYAVLYLPMIVSGVLILSKIRAEKNITFFDFLVITIVALNTLCLAAINTYPHYFTIYVPVFVLVVSHYFVWVRRWSYKTVLLAVCAGAYLFHAGSVTAQHIYTNHVLGTPAKTRQAIELQIEQIPPEERDAVVGYNFPCDYYLKADIIPCCKFYTHQTWWSTSDPSVMTSFLECVNSGEVLWLLVLPDEDDPEILKTIAEKYVLVAANDYFSMYKYKDGR